MSFKIMARGNTYYSIDDWMIDELSGASSRLDAEAAARRVQGWNDHLSVFVAHGQPLFDKAIERKSRLPRNNKPQIEISGLQWSETRPTIFDLSHQKKPRVYERFGLI